jgi:trimeric autotransporter adhesin
VASGQGALYSNTNGHKNSAYGEGALNDNTSGSNNTGIGLQALFSNTTGFSNTAIGLNALFNNATGSQNIALGQSAGVNLTTGNANIDIGNRGVAGESSHIRIGTQGTHTATYVAGIRGTPITGGIPVGVSSSGQLGVAPSSLRFKEAIKAMDKASEAIYALKPVRFRYKHELDPHGITQFGLVAEDVEKVNPDLVARDDHGKPFTVRYEAVNAMLLNEFLKEHKKVEEQQATIAELKSTVVEQRKHFEGISAQQHKEIQALTASVNEQASQIQKVSAQIEIGKFTTGRIRRSGHAPQMVLNNQ